MGHSIDIDIDRYRYEVKVAKTIFLLMLEYDNYY